jgi:hypothetical protein
VCRQGRRGRKNKLGVTLHEIGKFMLGKRGKNRNRTTLQQVGVSGPLNTVTAALALGDAGESFPLTSASPAWQLVAGPGTRTAPNSQPQSTTTTAHV